MILHQNKKALTALLEEVRTSDLTSFYSDRLTAVDITDFELTDIPLLERQDLTAVHPAARCYVPAKQVRFAAYTSGTSSGEPLVSYFTDVPNYHIDPAWGIEVSKLLIVFPPLNKSFSGTFVQQCAQAPNPLMAIFGDITNMASSAYLGGFVKCDALYATPTLALALAPYIEKYYDKNAIKLLVISGETIGASKLAALHALYPGAHIANLYASSEIGQFIMGPTKQMLKDEVQGFRLLPDAVVAAELLDDELVLTYGLNKAFPLLRYRTGDHFTVSKELTALYGAGLPILEWTGKGGVDVARVHGFEIRTGSIDAFFDALPQKIEQYQLHIHQGAAVESVALKMECISFADPEIIRTLVREHLLSEFMIGTLTLAEALDQDVVESVEVMVVPKLSMQTLKRRVLVNHIA